jgi:hypothetical protein
MAGLTVRQEDTLLKNAQSAIDLVFELFFIENFMVIHANHVK